MFRFTPIAVSPANSEANPATKVIQLRHGMINHWWICFPPACAGRVHVTVYHYDDRILPRDDRESLYWDNFVFSIPDDYQLTSEPYEIEVRAWTTAATYTYTPVVGVSLVPVLSDEMVDLLRETLAALVGVK